MQALMPQPDMPADADDGGGVNNLHRALHATHTPDEAARPTARSRLPAKVLVRYYGDDSCDEWIAVNSGRLRSPQGWGTRRTRHCCDEHVHTCHEHARACEDEDRSLEVAPAGLFGSCNGRYWQVQRPEGATEGHERAVRIKATLIVCPTHIGEQWHQEILRHTQANAVKVLYYYGLKAPPKDAAPVSLEEMASADIGPFPLPSCREPRRSRAFHTSG